MCLIHYAYTIVHFVMHRVLCIIHCIYSIIECIVYSIDCSIDCDIDSIVGSVVDSIVDSTFDNNLTVCYNIRRVSFTVDVLGCGLTGWYGVTTAVLWSDGFLCGLLCVSVWSSPQSNIPCGREGGSRCGVWYVKTLGYTVWSVMYCAVQCTVL